MCLTFSSGGAKNAWEMEPPCWKQLNKELFSRVRTEKRLHRWPIKNKFRINYLRSEIRERTTCSILGQWYNLKSVYQRAPFVR